MKTHGMLFSAPMVEALIDGRKTQTRRLIKSQPKDDSTLATFYPNIGLARFAHRHRAHLQDVKIPIRPGGLIWVKETFFAHGQWRVTPERTKTGKPKRYFARVAESAVLFDLDPGLVRPNNLNMVTGWYKRPSLFMEKADARLTLEVTDVRVQRLQEITREDAEAEGIRFRGNWEVDTGQDGVPDMDWEQGWGSDRVTVFNHGTSGTVVGGFQKLWDSLNADRAPWQSNPWVVAYTFKVHKRNVLKVAA